MKPQPNNEDTPVPQELNLFQPEQSETHEIQISITEGGKQAVDARELHNFLESKRDFSTWIKSKISKYGFVEGIDFIVFHKKVEGVGKGIGGRSLVEYLISLDMAKEISMVENNAKGKQARRYFIRMEKERFEQVQLSPREMEIIVFNNLKADKQRLELKVVTMEPKVRFAEEVLLSNNTVTVNDACSLAGLPWKAVTMNRVWFSLGIIYRMADKHYVPYAEYLKCGYFDAKERVMNDANTGKKIIKTQFRVTQTGIEWMLGMSDELKKCRDSLTA